MSTERRLSRYCRYRCPDDSTTDPATALHDTQWYVRHWTRTLRTAMHIKGLVLSTTQMISLFLFDTAFRDQRQLLVVYPHVREIR